MTKQGEVRDWEKDMKIVENFKFAQTLVNGIQPMFHGQLAPPEPIEHALEYWLQQYAVVEQRENKLREAITDMGGEYYTKNPVVNRLMNVLYLLYPEEGEAK